AVEVPGDVFRDRRDVVGDAAVTDGLRAVDTGGDGLAGCDDGDISGAAVAGEAQELRNQVRVGAAVAAGRPGDDLDRIGTARTGAAGLPDVDLIAAAVAHVL